VVHQNKIAWTFETNEKFNTTGCVYYFVNRTMAYNINTRLLRTYNLITIYIILFNRVSIRSISLQRVPCTVEQRL
jgi:hypothetical protein